MRALSILTVVITAVAMIPGGAHLFELPGKIDLPGQDYFLVQSIYRGWALFGIPLALALVANVLLSLKLRKTDRAGARWAMASAWLIAATLVHFFVRVFPANQATRNWTTMPANWESLRIAWEYGHAINAVVLLAAFVATTMAAVRR